MISDFESHLSEKFEIDISISLEKYYQDKHLAGKEALSKTKYSSSIFTSISHSTGLAFAISAPSDSTILGIGIDFEGFRSLDFRASRMFLSKNELESLNDKSNDNLLRLWTIKESIFKSAPDNSGLFLRNFEVQSPEAREGNATCAERPELKFQYSNTKIDHGMLSVAICTAG